MLQDKTKLLEKISQVLPNPVYIFSIAEGTLIWLNERHTELYGYTTEQTLAMSKQFLTEVIHSEDLPLIFETIQRGLTLKDHEVIELEYRFRDHQGGYHWVYDRVTVFGRDEQGLACSLLGVATDIDERKHHEEALKKTLEKLNLSLTAAQMGTWEWDPITERAHWDAQTCEIHGEPSKSSLTPYKIVKSRILPEDYPLALEKFLETHRTHQDLNLLYRVRLDNGDIRHIRCHGRFIEGNSKLYGVSWDASEEIRAQKQIEDARAKLIAGAKMAALGEMSGGIAHEINNPLTVIQARAFQLMQMVEAQRLDPVKISEAAESISRTADKIARIIKSMRSFSREGSTDPFESILLSELINNALEFCQARFYHHGIDIEVNLEKIDAELEVECRLVQIEQVLLNLLNNSFDAIESSAQKWIRIEASSDKNFVEIRVVDSGPGIPPDQVDQIMLPFFTTKAPDKGTGLGLSISSGIVKAHKGDLFLETQAPHTTFVVRLPLVQGNSNTPVMEEN